MINEKIYNTQFFGSLSILCSTFFFIDINKHLSLYTLPTFFRYFRPVTVYYRTPNAITSFCNLLVVSLVISYYNDSVQFELCLLVTAMKLRNKAVNNPTNYSLYNQCCFLTVTFIQTLTESSDHYHGDGLGFIHTSDKTMLSWLAPTLSVYEYLVN